MRKALITIVKKQIIDSNTENKFLQEFFNKVYESLEWSSERNGIGKYSIEIDGRIQSKKEFIDQYLTEPVYNLCFQLRKVIPEFWDLAKRVNFRMRTYPTQQLPVVRAEVIQYTNGEKGSFKIVVYFETEQLILLDSISDKLLLSFQNDADNETNIFTDTFFLQLSDDIYFNEYKL